MDGIEKTIDQYFDLQKQIHDYFSYVEDWKVIPMDDQRDTYWMLIQNDDGTGRCVWSDKPFTEKSITDGMEIYSGIIYTQRFLPKYVYEAEKYTMISVDTRTDGNKFLMIFDNNKRCKDIKLIELYLGAWA